MLSDGCWVVYTLIQPHLTWYTVRYGASTSHLNNSFEFKQYGSIPIYRNRKSVNTFARTIEIQNFPMPISKIISHRMKCWIENELTRVRHVSGYLCSHIHMLLIGFDLLHTGLNPNWIGVWLFGWFWKFSSASFSHSFDIVHSGAFSKCVQRKWRKSKSRIRISLMRHCTI